MVADHCVDRSESIALEYGARVVSGSFPLEGPRKEAGVAACSGQWIIEIDADEWVSAQLAQEIRRKVENGASGDDFQVPDARGRGLTRLC